MGKGTGYILRSTKEGGPVFDILTYNAESKVGLLRRVGGSGVEFKESLDKERLKQYGYRIEPKPAEVSDAQQPQVPA